MADDVVPHFSAYAIMLATSLVAALAIIFSFAEVFIPSHELSFIVRGVAVYLCVTFAILTWVGFRTQRAAWLAIAATGLVAIAVLIEELPVTRRFLDAQSTNPFKMGRQFFVETAYLILVPVVVGIGIQWQMLLRHWRKRRGETTALLWPWFTTIAALVVALNPLGIAILKGAIEQSPTDWLRGLWLLFAEIGAGVLMVLAIVEYYFRVRKSRRVVET